MIYFKAQEESTGRFLEAHLGKNNELFIEVNDGKGNCETIVLDNDQVDVLLMFIQLKSL